jgi:dienelactone hydrolase
MFAFLACLVVVESASADTGPLVDRPSDWGPFRPARVDGEIQTSTKTYSTPVRYYYPGTTVGWDATPDTTEAPYMTIVWFPGFGGPYDSYQDMADFLTSWGAVVMTVGVNWSDWPRSGYIEDMEDFLDHLETLNVTPGSKLYGMVDKEAFGVSGHSSGGGLSLVDGAMVDRIKAVQSFAAAISSNAVDGIAQYWDKPLLLQVGEHDSGYIAGSRRAYEKIGYPNSLVEIRGADHMGPWEMHLFSSFYLYHLAGKNEYWTFLYGDEAVADAASGRSWMHFKLSPTHFFPPEIETTVSGTDVFMDEPVDLNATIAGYQRVDDPVLVHGWDLDGDLVADINDTASPNMSAVFDGPGTHEVTYIYDLGEFVLTSDPHTVVVSNRPPVAFAGPDVTVGQDGNLTLDGSASIDTPSDHGSLLFMWTFSDGIGTNASLDPTVNRVFPKEGVVVAKLIVFDPHGAQAEDNLNVTVVNVLPIAEAGQDISVEEDEIFELAGLGSDTPSDMATLRYRWDFGDGFGTEWVSVAAAFHSYPSSGVFTAVMHVKDDNGDTATDELNVTVVNVAPTAEVVSPDGNVTYTKDEVLGFHGVGHDGASDIDTLEYRWDFGDGTGTDWGSYSQVSTVYAYILGGTYMVTLHVRDDDGSAASASVVIEVVNEPPQPAIVSPGLEATVDEDETLRFRGFATDTVSDVTSLTYSWTVLDETYQGQVHEHVFTEVGEYLVTFNVVDPEGARASLTVTVAVTNVVPMMTASLNKTQVLVDETFEFLVLAFDTISDAQGLIILWDFGDGNSSNASPEPTRSPGTGPTPLTSPSPTTTVPPPPSCSSSL